MPGLSKSKSSPLGSQSSAEGPSPGSARRLEKTREKIDMLFSEENKKAGISPSLGKFKVQVIESPLPRRNKPEAALKMIPNAQKPQLQKVKLDIGGFKYSTSLSTLTSDEDSIFYEVFSGQFEPQKDEDGSIFIDRDGRLFYHVLNYLRDGSIPKHIGKDELEWLYNEACFYNLKGLVAIIEDRKLKKKNKKKRSSRSYRSDSTSSITSDLSTFSTVSSSSDIESSSNYKSLCDNLSTLASSDVPRTLKDLMQDFDINLLSDDAVVLKKKDAPSSK